MQCLKQEWLRISHIWVSDNIILKTLEILKNIERRQRKPAYL
jgi:hypothetical protein